MRIGTLIAREFLKADRTWSLPKDPPIGIIIGLEMECDSDGNERPGQATIRWDNGLVETIPMEDPNGSWSLCDVTPTFYANLYLQDRAYGGPEEGGWWYDTLTPATDYDWDNPPPPYGHFLSPQQAEAAATKLREWCDNENSNRRPISSTASKGVFIVALESWPAEHYPKQRPYYC